MYNFLGDLSYFRMVAYKSISGVMGGRSDNDAARSQLNQNTDLDIKNQDIAI